MAPQGAERRTGRSRAGGAGPDDQPPTAAPTYDCRKAFADELIALAREDDRIVAVCNDSVGSSNLVGFRDEFPDRLINVGIAEQDLVGVGAGLANGGLIPFVSRGGAVPDRPRARADQGRRRLQPAPTSCCAAEPRDGLRRARPDPPLDRGPVLDAGDRRTCRCVVPADPAQTRAAVRWAAAHPGPELPAHRPVPGPGRAPRRHARSSPGVAIQLADGDDVTVIAVGTMVSRALVAAADRLRGEGVVGPGAEHGLRRTARRGRGARGAPRRPAASSPRRRRPSTGGLGAAVAASLVAAAARRRCGSWASAASSRRPAAPSSCSSTSGSPPTASPPPPGSSLGRWPRTTWSWPSTRAPARPRRCWSTDGAIVASAAVPVAPATRGPAGSSSRRGDLGERADRCRRSVCGP